MGLGHLWASDGLMVTCPSRYYRYLCTTLHWCTIDFELMIGTGAGVYRIVLGVLSSAISAVMYRIVGKGQRFIGPMDGR